MLICIDNLLAPDMLSTVREEVRKLDFKPGAETAGWHAREVKANAQAADSPALKIVRKRIVEALQSSALVRGAALPNRIAAPLISRYGPGDSYGSHTDDALMGNPPMRSDLSVTVFLNAPEDYEGGELIAESASGEEAVKLAAGSAVLYPSTTLHRVAEVTSGERLAAVTWIESHVRDPAAREILFDLDRARRAVFASEGRGETFGLLAKSYANLLRRWAGK